MAFAIANHHVVKFVADPFMDPSGRSDDSRRRCPTSCSSPCSSVSMVGWITAWLGQGHWRRAARKTHKEATIWKREAENLKRGLEAVAPKGAQPPARSSSAHSSPRLCWACVAAVWPPLCFLAQAFRNTMTVSVKICGISTVEALETAIEAGADYAGFVFFERSPRNVDALRARLRWRAARRAASRLWP